MQERPGGLGAHVTQQHTLAPHIAILHGEEALTVHILHEKGASGIKHELVGVKHVPTVRLQLDVTQVWVINHGSEVGQQQAEGERSLAVPLWGLFLRWQDKPSRWKASG